LAVGIYEPKTRLTPRLASDFNTSPRNARSTSRPITRQLIRNDRSTASAPLISLTAVITMPWSPNRSLTRPWRTSPEAASAAMAAISASVLLTDNDALNGPLMLMPGSHRRYVSCAGETPQDNHKSSLKKQEIGVPSPAALSEMAGGFGIDYAAGKAGTVILFDCNTMHGSNGNITPFPRSNAFFVYNAWSNRLEAPFAAPAPRPDFLADSAPASPIAIESGRITGGAS